MHLSPMLSVVCNRFQPIFEESWLQRRHYHHNAKLNHIENQWVSGVTAHSWKNGMRGRPTDAQPAVTQVGAPCGMQGMPAVNLPSSVRTQGRAREI